MDVRAKISSKGQVTIPKRVRDALDLHEGDELVFRVERSRALVAKTPRGATSLCTQQGGGAGHGVERLEDVDAFGEHQVGQQQALSRGQGRGRSPCLPGTAGPTCPAIARGIAAVIDPGGGASVGAPVPRP